MRYAAKRARHMIKAVLRVISRGVAGRHIHARIDNAYLLFAAARFDITRFRLRPAMREECALIIAYC